MPTAGFYYEQPITLEPFFKIAKEGSSEPSLQVVWESVKAAASESAAMLLFW
jgi:hypothetical protein